MTAIKIQHSPYREKFKKNRRGIHSKTKSSKLKSSKNYVKRYHSQGRN